MSTASAVCCSAVPSPRARMSRRRETAGGTHALAGNFPASEGWKPLFNGKDLSGWNFRNPRAKKVWVVCDQVRLDPADPARLIPVGNGESVGRPALRRRRPRLRHHDPRRRSPITSSISSSPSPREETREYTTGGSSRSRSSTASASQSSAFTTAVRSTSGLFPVKILRSRLASGSRLTSRSRERSYSLSGTASRSTGPGRPLRRDRPRRVRAAQPGKRRQAAEPSGEASKRGGPLRRLFRRGGHAGQLDGPDRPGPILLQGDHGPVAYRNILIRPLK